MEEPKLAEPGAGLPPLQWALARFILVPLWLTTGNQQNALSRFERESKKILSIAGALNEDQLSRRILVPPLAGLEDSSRYWSIAMAMHHLISTDEAARALIHDLSTGGTSRPPLRIQDHKPPVELNPAATINTFRETIERFVKETSNACLEAYPKATYHHPWFGAFTARDWLIFTAIHQGVHRRQIEVIARRL